MPSPFDALDAALSGAVLSAFGETVSATLRPRTRSEYAVAADPARPERQLRGVFSAAPDDPKLRGAAMGAEFSGGTRLSVTLAEYWVAAADLAALPYAIKPGDALVFPGRAGSPVYSISDLHQNETGDVNLILTAGQG